MPNAELTREVIDASKRLIELSPDGDVDGQDIAREIGRDPNEIEIRNAFREAERLGELEPLAWDGGMGLPRIVRLPHV